ncbi:MAG: hypothetical protein JXA93_25005 [Anaerolineae bacterium]|nr:hypothetical protein [Anaerolineae bacterium]
MQHAEDAPGSMDEDRQQTLDLVSAACATWPVLGRWRSRVAASRRAQSVLQATRSPGFRRRAQIAIVSIFVTFIGLAVYQNWSELQAYEWRADVRYPLLALVTFPLAYLPNAWCWHRIISRVSTQQGARANAHIYFLSSLGRYVPGGIWHIAGRAYWYRDRGVPAYQIVIASVWENTIVVVSGLIVYALLTPGLQILGGVGAAVSAVALPAVLNRLVEGAGKKLGLSSGSVRAVDVVVLYGAIGVAWAVGGGILWLVINAVFPLEVAAAPAVIAAWGLAGAVGMVAGVLVGGLGIREITIGALLGQIVPVPVAIVAAIGFRLVVTASEMVWALALSWLTSRKVK